jgi:diguanylate cyclase
MPVIAVVLVVGILNLAVGYLAAVALAESPPWNRWRLRAPRLSLAKFKKPRGDVKDSHEPSAAPPDLGAPSAAAKTTAAAPAPPAATIAGVAELPGEWLAQLAAAGIVAESFVEGVAQVLRLEVMHYRERLLATESRCRALIASADAAGLQLLGDDLRVLNLEWLEKQIAAAKMLSQRSGRLGDHETAAADLEQALVDQAAEIRGACTQLETHDALSGADGGGKLLLDQTTVLLNHAHALRDRMLDLLATLLRTGQRLEVLGAASQVDPLTGMTNRIGLEAALAAWWREDPERSRLLSVILIDIDRFARLNQRLGTKAGDRTIAAVGRLCDETLRKDGGYERLALRGAESLVIVMGDTGPHQALTTAERLRQTVEAATFDNDGVEFELTLSCGVIEVGRSETVRELLSRAGETAKYAKRAGRNRCAIDEGQGPQTLEPPQFPVKGRIVKLGEAE